MNKCAALTIQASFKSTSSGINDENNTVRLGRSVDHGGKEEIPVSRGIINDSAVVLCCQLFNEK